MNQNDNRDNLVIGTGQIAAAMVALAVLAVAGLTFALGLNRFTGAPQPISTGALGQIGFAPTSVLGPTSPLTPSVRTHVVQTGETLIGIAAQYGLTTRQLQDYNGISDPNTIYVGQELHIPDPSYFPPTAIIPTPAITPTITLAADEVFNISLLSGWQRSILEGDLEANYPLLFEHSRFRLHYQPGTLPDLQLGELVLLVEESLARVEARLEVNLRGSFDVYAAGTLFEAPDAALRGRSFSRERNLFILYDGSGTPAENAYLVTHELTHLVAWNTYGPPSSTMISEALATWAGRPELEAGGFISYDQLCLGAFAAGQIRSMAVIENEPDEFQGHIQNRFNYFGSACFMDYLIRTYGLESIADLYSTSEYLQIYGRTLHALDRDWQMTLADRLGTLALDPDTLVNYTNEVSAAYTYVFNAYNATPTLHYAYFAVDRARIALWQGDYDSARRWLDTVYAVTGYTP